MGVLEVKVEEPVSRFGPKVRNNRHNLWRISVPGYDRSLGPARARRYLKEMEGALIIGYSLRQNPAVDDLISADMNFLEAEIKRFEPVINKWLKIMKSPPGKSAYSRYWAKCKLRYLGLPNPRAQHILAYLPKLAAELTQTPK